MKLQTGRTGAAKGSIARNGAASRNPGAESTVTFEVMNPRGTAIRPPVVAPSPRVTDLAGKRIGIYWNEKEGADNLFDVLEEMLKERFPTAFIERYKGLLDPGDDAAANMAKGADTFIYGVGD